MFADFPEQSNVTAVLQRSLERDRLAHAYLFIGHDGAELEAVARTLAKALNCLNAPGRAPNGAGLDSCDACDSCRRIDADSHPDVLWERPESKTRIITIDQMRELMQSINLKPGSARFKVGVIAGADRLNVQAANSFLKTLEEPPSQSVLILLTTEPQRILETILSRCLRLTFAGEGAHFTPEQSAWLADFSAAAADKTGGLFGRYRLLDVLLKKLSAIREEVEKSLSARSPLERYEDLDPKMRDKLEDELAAAVEAEYRRRRTELVGALHWWLRDVWLQAVQPAGAELCFPDLAPGARAIAARIAPADALDNLECVDRLQRRLHSNVQEALALEVGLLQLKL